MTHICVSKLTIIDSDNGLLPGRRQAIIWTNGGILLIRNLGKNLSKISSKIHTFSFTKMHLKMSAKWRQFCLSLNVLSGPHCRLVHSFQVQIQTVECHYTTHDIACLWSPSLAAPEVVILTIIDAALDENFCFSETTIRKQIVINQKLWFLHNAPNVFFQGHTIIAHLSISPAICSLP